MNVNEEKLKALVKTMSDDQKKLLQEGLAQGKDLDPKELAAIFGSAENQKAFQKIIDEPGLTRW